jgi:hypothetical protein
MVSISGFAVATREIVKANLSKSSRWDVNVSTFSTLKSDLDSDAFDARWTNWDLGATTESDGSVSALNYEDQMPRLFIFQTVLSKFSQSLLVAKYRPDIKVSHLAVWCIFKPHTT